MRIHIPATVLLLLFAFSPSQAADWNNAGGNAGRNGQTPEVGPDAATVAWAGGRSSIIAWQPVIAGDRVFVVRQAAFPPEQTGSPVIAMDLHTGAEVWRRDLPANSGDWTTWVAGARDGRVYAARSGNGASVAALMYALDAATGATIWTSQDTTRAGAYDGVVFADNGDLIVGDFNNITRIRASDGTTAWRVARIGSVSGQCGTCLRGDAVYVADAAPGGHVIKRFNADSGTFQYQSPVMAGFTLQNTPMVSPDGTIYLSRTQNNAGVDFFYAINDDGAAMTIRWSVAARWTVVSEFAVAPDNSVYMMAPGNVIKRLDPATGATLATSAAIASDANAQPRMAVDSAGRLFLCNGSFANGRFYSFNADLSPRWDIAVPNSNIGSPAIGCDGTLVIAGIGTSVTGYRTERCQGDLDLDGQVGLSDLTILLGSFGAEAGAAAVGGDSDCDGDVDLSDLSVFLSRFGVACP